MSANLQPEERNAPGVTRIAAAFAEAGKHRKAALMPYFTLGFPDRLRSTEIIQAISLHSDLIELGIPFSDPIADGPTIQRSTQLALENGTTTSSCLEQLQTLRDGGMNTPVLLMGYYNPILAYGEANFVRDAAAAGADGFIVPDLPLEESLEFEALAAEAGLAFIHFLAPTSDDSRIVQVAKKARGFIYMVSLTGVTGARQRLEADLPSFIARVRRQTQIPLAVGFGISDSKQALAVGRLADGVIIGSALINVVADAEDKPAAAAHFVRSLAMALAHN